MKQLVNFIIMTILALVVVMTLVFTFLQLQKSQTIDERLVSSLTTKLDTALIKQVIDKVR